MHFLWLLIFFAERVRNISMEKVPGNSNPTPSEYQSDALTIKPLGPLAEERITSYISSIAQRPQLNSS